MIEHLYKSEEYIDDLDNLENLADTLLQIIMDDGMILKRREKNFILNNNSIFHR